VTTPVHRGARLRSGLDICGAGTTDKKIFRIGYVVAGGVLTYGGRAESSVPQVMVSELAAFGADHD